MIATLPRSSAGAPDYRYALDATMPLVSNAGATHVICNAVSLRAEVLQRLPLTDHPGSAAAGLWLEPLVHSWEVDLDIFTLSLSSGAPLVIIASQPLARVLPGRESTNASALGARATGMRTLQHGLTHAGFNRFQHFGVRTVHSSLVGLAGNVAERCGRGDWSDQLQFASRLRYCSSGQLRSFAAVGLIIARKEAP